MKKKSKYSRIIVLIDTRKVIPHKTKYIYTNVLDKIKLIPKYILIYINRLLPPQKT